MGIEKRSRSLRAASVVMAFVLAVSLVFCTTAPDAFAAKKNGKVKENGYLYYYRDGKKVTNDIVKLSGVNYYFSAKGRGFRSLKNKNGNKAMAKVIDNVKFNSKLTKRGKLRRCYKYIVKMTYMVEDAPDTSKSGWYYKSAKSMAYNKGGKCYGFASLAAVSARALGYSKVKLHLGKSRRTKKDSYSEHCWVTIGDKVLDASYDNSYWARNGRPSNPSLKFFFKTYDDIRKNNPDNFKVQYKDGKTYILK